MNNEEVFLGIVISYLTLPSINVVLPSVHDNLDAMKNLFICMFVHTVGRGMLFVFVKLYYHTSILIVV